ncbi:MAG: homocysteine S-methyltransferase family protein [Bacteroidales bacterium]|nr:homocysteine S-methyltransferase family protein [Bacteroidales bacterium]
MGKILDKLATGKVLVSDGAWGTFLHQKGLKADECPELWNMHRSDDVLQIASSYVEAGADIILTNSFGASPIKLEGYGLEEQTQVLNRRAAEISKQAAADRALVMGSIGPTGKMVMMGEVSPQEVFKGFIEQTMGLADGGADGIVIETMTDPEEARIAIEAVKKASELDVACTFTFSKNQDGVYRTMMGTDVEAYLEMAKLAGADIIGANCGNGTAGMIEIVREIRTLDPDIPVLVHANAGLPIYQDGLTVFPESASEMASQMGELVAAGANIVGGCCGTTPEHIRQIVQVLSNLT